MPRMRVFWSVYCILLGLILLLKLLFHWDFSAWSAALALLFLESGVFLLTGSFGLYAPKRSSGGRHLFLTGRISLAHDAPVTTLLCSNVHVDLTAPMPKVTYIRSAFSNVTVRIPEGHSVRTVCQSALSTVETPHETLRGFADRVLIIGDGLQSQLVVQSLFSQLRILD